MKGIGKALSRTPFMVTSKVGMSKKSTDPEFDDYQRNFAVLETAAEKFLKDTKAFTDAVNTLFTAGSSLAQHFSILFHPIASEYDLLGKFPEAAHTIKNVDAYHTALEELRTSISPELELIESRVVGPVRELQGVMKAIRKMITKRDHKLMDYDRFNNSLTKLRDKKEKSLSDEKNLYKLEQDFEIATNEYENVNAAMKQDLPRFMTLATRFIDPLFHSFYYMQLNIYYMILEKISQFSEGKYTIDMPAAQIATDYEEKRGDAAAVIEALSINQRFISTSKMVSQNRSLASGTTAVSRSTSSASTLTTSSRTAPPSFTKKPPPPPPSFGGSGKTSAPPSPVPSAAAPPPYTASASASAAAAAIAAAKRAPPPPPPLKPKLTPVNYVVALYDFAAQAEGDLDFKVGDRIEVVERSESTEDWWTGRLDGRTGVFPGNYVQDV
ncbi:BAR-domain-containing protein [Lactarius akahatsu]|uniref:BAR-domain-containing protein n=1 Tax=Lactarius akahatsu TaxID=416441 RepID=A0AAD4LI01_9AGAM|nr:BAR-domain-containing protein [Lactarius akahatsu]